MKNELKKVVGGMLDGYSQENIKLYEKSLEGCGTQTYNDPESFYLAEVYNFERCIDGYLSVKVSEAHEVKFIYSNYGYIESHLDKLFTRFEGSAMCGDKTRTIINYLISYYHDGFDGGLDYSTEYTFMLPDKILKTHEEITHYFQCIYKLFYGNYSDYVKLLIKLEVEFTQE